MDDDSLRLELESRGQKVGPIVDSTRQVYRKLLKRLIEEEMAQLMDDMPDNEPNAGQPSATTVGQRSAKKWLTSFVHFAITLILCAVFAYFVKLYKK